MAAAGILFALDLATSTGFAIGRPGEIPRSGTVVLKKPKQPRGVAGGNLMAWLQEEWRAYRPTVVVVEAPMHLGAWLKIRSSEDNVLLQLGIHGVVEAMCSRYGIEHVSAYAQSVRKHFIGRTNLGDRKATKAAVIERCRLLGYVPKGCTDDNRCDALAVWDFAAAKLAKARPGTLHMFGEKAA